jgi:hypothetical protein
MTEKQPYKVLSSQLGFEIREYPAGLHIQTKVRGDFETAGSRGFSPLVRFISGNNSDRASIAMTAPVIQSSSSESDHVVSFVLPKNLTEDMAPKAVDSGVRVINVPEHTAAARTFSGSWSKGRYEKEAAELLSKLSLAGIEAIGEVYFARFDPPWKPGFLRHNEVLVRVKS